MTDKVKVGQRVRFHDFDGVYSATVTRINRGVLTIKYYIRGTGAVSYLKANDDRLEAEEAL